MQNGSYAVRPIQPASVGSPLRYRPQETARQKIIKIAPLLVVFYSFLLLPSEVAISLAGLNFPSYRLALLAMALPAFLLVVRNPGFRFNVIDLAIVVASGWILLSYSMIYGFAVGVVRGSGILFDFFLPYLVARASIRSPDELRYFLLLCLPGLLFAAGSMAIESLSGRLLVRPAFAAVFGNVSTYENGEAVGSLVLKEEYRLGLLRAFGPFAHPILGGAMMASLLPLYFFSGLRSWPYFLGLAAAFAGVFSLSSAAFLALLLGVAAIGLNWVKGYFAKISWWLMVTALSAVVALLHFASNGGIFSIISRLTLNPQTAGYRTLIWEYGMQSVARYPWLGIGYQQWERLSWMPETVDAHFLLLAIRHGIAVPFLLFGAMLYGVIVLGMKLGFVKGEDRRLLIGINISIVLILIVAQTVNFFGSANILLMSFVGFLGAMIAWCDDYIWRMRAMAMQMARQQTAMGTRSR